MNPEMIAHINEWLEHCDTLQSSFIMTGDEIIEYVVKGKEDPHEDETTDLAAVENEDEGIEFIGILDHISLRKWFDDKDALAFVSLVERARRDFKNFKTKQT